MVDTDRPTLRSGAGDEPRNGGVKRDAKSDAGGDFIHSTVAKSSPSLSQSGQTGA